MTQPPPKPQAVAQSAPPGSIIVTKNALEGMLASFALAMTGLLQLTPNKEALRVIAKATVEEHFPSVDGPLATPAPPQPLHRAQQPAEVMTRETTLPIAEETRMELRTPSPLAQHDAQAAVAAAPQEQARHPQHAHPRATRARVPPRKSLVVVKPWGQAPSRTVPQASKPQTTLRKGR